MLYIFNNIRERQILDQIENNQDFTSSLINFAMEKSLNGNILKKYILYTLIYNENPYTLCIERDREYVGDTKYVDMDLKYFYDIYNMKLDNSELENFTFKKFDQTNLVNLVDELYDNVGSTYESFKKAIISFYRTYGVGTMAVYKAFRVDDGVLKPIKYVLDVTFDSIIGYEDQKKLLIDNTKFFISGKSYNNVLLYGESGTGKSTSIKAMLNEFYKDGLRIIEVYKHQMEEISKIIHQLKSRPYYYVIYMDDLSFEPQEVEYKYLKSIIEGGIEPKPNNVAIYATSNRRHLIKETTADNYDVFDDLHRSETQAEKLSLAYRFGLQIYYGSLSVAEFRNMVLELCKQNDINVESQKLIKEASAWEMKYGSLSGRCAQQFINYIKNKYEA